MNAPSTPTAERLDVTVVICAYTEDRLDDLVLAIESVRAQVPGPQEIVVVIDHNERLLAEVRGRWGEVEVIPSEGPKGLSGARNTGLAVARKTVVAFIDDDAVAASSWLASLTAAANLPGVFAAGGHVEPQWLGPQPAWLPPEFLWVVGCSWNGLPDSASPVRNPIGANMAIRRAVFEDVGGFETALGRVGAIPLGCEETEFCIRARRATGHDVLYEPRAVVHHKVPAVRASIRYVLRRCYAEGLSKAVVARLSGANLGLSAERRHVFRTLPAALGRDLLGLARRRPGAAGRLFVLLCGTLVTAAGFVAGCRRVVRAAEGEEPATPSRGLAPRASEVTADV